MNASEAPQPPSGYPDASVVGWVRTEDVESAGLHIRMTIAPADRIVQLWELEDGHPVLWLGNAFRIESEPPGLYLNHRYEARLSRGQRDLLARAAAKFWKS
ncbi:hypothetical protein AB0B28_17245 [Glycomyces sp. NPDC046736]|uniref:hypothetical protein n=1 Tax=Glycomyces sp. NPDC046736 TaxID=3155615 RepID=UPI0033E5DAA1